MSQHDKPTMSSADVLNRIRDEIEAPSVVHPDSDVAARVARIRSMQRDLRIEPLGGRLLPVKRMVYWFVASTFDRQAKVVEALLDLVRDVGAENEQQRAEVRHLRAAIDDLRSAAAGSADAVRS